MLPIWIIYLLILIPTRFASVQNAMTEFADQMDVNWVTSWVDCIIRFFPYLLIVLLGSSIYELRKRPKFDTIRIYEDKIGFVLNGEERTAEYKDVVCSYGKFQQSFYLSCKVLNLPQEQYYFNALSDARKLETELKNIGKLP